MKAYKGFNKDMTCRGFQYEEGKIYECEKAEMCESGFHACENPLDCFSYYSPNTSVYHEVEIEDNGERQNEDTKVVGKKIKIGAALSVADICKLHFEFVKSHCEPANNNAAGDKGSASAGNYGSASAGYRGSAISRGSADVGENGIALVRGNDCKVKGGLNSVLTICEEKSNNCEIKFCKTFHIDGKQYKPDVWYTLDENGKVVKAEEY